MQGCDHLKIALHDYLLQFTQENFHMCTNQQNAFFNEQADDKYIQIIICVFWQTQVTISSDWYDPYMKQGLLDKTHAISELVSNLVKHHSFTLPSTGDPIYP